MNNSPEFLSSLNNYYKLKINGLSFKSKLDSGKKNKIYFYFFFIIIIGKIKL